MVVSVFASYALARKKFRGAAIVMLIVLATMMLPEEVVAIPLSVVLSDLPLLHVNLIGTYLGMILPDHAPIGLKCPPLVADETARERNVFGCRSRAAGNEKAPYRF